MKGDFHGIAKSKVQLGKWKSPYDYLHTSTQNKLRLSKTNARFS